MNLDGKSLVLGVIGNPIGHSLSPLLQNAMLEENGENAVYVPFEITNVKDVVAGIKGLGIVGINVTVPHKTEIIKYMDYVSDEASHIGAVNTVVNKNGVLYGYNTDVEGVFDAMTSAGICVEDKNVLILGGGGAAKGVAYSTAKHGAKIVDIKNRTLSKAQEISDMIKKYFDVESDVIENVTDKYDVVINTTSVGMYPNDKESPIDDYSVFKNGADLVDIVYKPLETTLMKNAKTNGAGTIINGLDMLIYQGIYSLELFLDRNLDKKAMYECIIEKLKLEGKI